MKWDRRTVTTVLIVMVSVAFASFLIKFSMDHDGESITLGDDPSSSAEQFETGDTDPASGLAWVEEQDLPVEGQATLALIDQGGPFPYEKDGGVFGNFEGILPDHESGYYHEYTVLTPGSTERGARRIVTGSSEEYYWTEDHYRSFERIAR